MCWARPWNPRIPPPLRGSSSAPARGQSAVPGYSSHKVKTNKVCESQLHSPWVWGLKASGCRRRRVGPAQRSAVKSLCKVQESRTWSWNWSVFIFLLKLRNVTESGLRLHLFLCRWTRCTRSFMWSVYDNASPLWFGDTQCCVSVNCDNCTSKDIRGGGGGVAYLWLPVCVPPLSVNWLRIHDGVLREF